jgi:uncharacterized protein YndB with AHSA1/START domain
MKNTLKVTTPADREVVLTREFDAPRRLVWQAFARPELIKRWLFGPPGWEMTACEEELRPGGAFRWAWRGPDGAAMAMHGVYREVVAPERIVRTETFDFGCDAQSGEQVATLALAERGGKTTLTLTVLYPSKEARDAAVASGMEHGVAAGYDRLEEMLTAGLVQEPAK